MYFWRNRSARVRIARWTRSWELPGAHGILRMRLEMASYEAKSSRICLRAAAASLLGGESELRGELNSGNEVQTWAYLSVSSSSWNCGRASSISFSRVINAYDHAEYRSVKVVRKYCTSYNRTNGGICDTS